MWRWGNLLSEEEACAFGDATHGACKHTNPENTRGGRRTNRGIGLRVRVEKWRLAVDDASEVITIRGKWSRILGPGNPKREQALVLMAAVNAIDTIHRAMAHVPHAAGANAFEKARDQGASIRFFLIAVGYLKEAAQSFRDLLPEIRSAVKKANDPALSICLSNAVSLLDQNGPLWAAIKTLRDDAAFHFQRKPLMKALARLSDEESQRLAVLQRTEDEYGHRFVLADVVTVLAAGIPVDKDQMAELMGNVREAMNGFLNVSVALLAHELTASGVSVEMME